MIRILVRPFSSRFFQEKTIPVLEENSSYFLKPTEVNSPSLSFYGLGLFAVSEINEQMAPKALCTLLSCTWKLLLNFLLMFSSLSA